MRAKSAIAMLMILTSGALAQTASGTRGNGAPSGHSRPATTASRASSIGDPKDGGVASNNAYGHSRGTTGGTYHGRKAGPLPRPHNAPMPGNAPGDKP